MQLDKWELDNDSVGDYLDEDSLVNNLDEDSLVDYLDEVDNPDWEVPDIDFSGLETAEPQAAQGGDIYPAHRN